MQRISSGLFLAGPRATLGFPSPNPVPGRVCPCSALGAVAVVAPGPAGRPRYCWKLVSPASSYKALPSPPCPGKIILKLQL